MLCTSCQQARMRHTQACTSSPVIKIKFVNYAFSLPSGIVENGAMNNGHYDLYPSEHNLVLALVSIVKTFK